MKMKRVIICLATVLACSICHAGGSFDFADQLLPLLEQQPELKRYIMSTLDRASSGFAGRIGQSVNPHLGGTRVGPYLICAKPKGTSGAYTLKLTFHTDLVFLDAIGRKVDLTTGVKVVETLTSLEIAGTNNVSNRLPAN